MAKTKEERAAYHREWYQRNRERVLAQSKEHHATNRERDRETRRKYRAENKDKIRGQLRELKLRRIYKITSAEYDALLCAQDNCCAACGLPADGERLVVDHDHMTGEVRGLLHRTCNLLVGQIENCKGYINNVLDYIDQKTNWRRRAEMKRAS